ncbi:MAG: hypothetical protein ACTHU0_13295 [Kofleriaceae bacterium]
MRLWSIAFVAVAACGRAGEPGRAISTEVPAAPPRQDLATFPIAGDDGTVFLLVKPRGGDRRVHAYRRAPQRDAWEPLPVPEGTLTLAARGGRVVALASDALFETRDAGASWQRWALPPAPFSDLLEMSQPTPPHYRDVAFTPRGELLALAWDRVVRISDDGAPTNLAILPEVGPGAGLVELAPGEDLVAVADQRGQVWRLDTTRGALARWSEGLDAFPEGVSGSARVAWTGGRFVALRSGRFERGPGDAAWARTDENRGVPRGLCAIGDGWIEADDRGVRRIGADRAVRWSFEPDALVSQIACVGDEIVVGDYRASRELAAIVVRADGSHAAIALPAVARGERE